MSVSVNVSGGISLDNSKHLRVALVGKPNCGKTALFNALTGSRQKVANYSGVTVEKKHGYFKTPDNTLVTLVDLPGTYSLRSRSPDEKVTRDVVLNQFKEEKPVDLIMAVVDATNLSGSLRLVLELKQTGIPLVIALNMIDLAKLRGFEYDIEKLSNLLNCPVIPTSAVKKSGISNLVAEVDRYDQLETTSNRWQEPDRDMVREYHKEVHSIIRAIEKRKGMPSLWSARLDKLFLHPVLGLFILLAILFCMFQAVFSWATIPQGWMQDTFDSLQAYVAALNPNSFLVSLVANGIIAGVGSVIVFLPQILTISLFIILLEDTGYMARAAFLMDKLMGGVGLHGRAFIPLLSSFACAIPGIMATRTIENRKDRLVTILIAPLMTCSARLPVYTLLISAFIPVKTVWGFANLQGLVMFALFAAGIIFGLIMAFIFKTFFFKGDRQPLMLELPSYKAPNLYNVLLELIKPAKSFLRRAGTIILSVMIIIWFLSSFPLPPEHATAPAIDYSIAGIVGKFLEPLFRPIGFNWQIVVALIPGMAAREVAVSVLATIFALSGTNDDVIREGLTVILQHAWTLPTALSLITWYVFAPQCISTLAVAKRETNSWKWPTIMFIYQMMLAYLMSLAVFNLARYFIH
jgi:ferrous iron transport protein B